ncbi:MAG TPA: hypothetical protein VD963_00650 [Phycisphaerales bacterium]|nr:hypothetical protein [Phycisphaerales bacterium]
MADRARPRLAPEGNGIGGGGPPMIRHGTPGIGPAGGSGIGVKPANGASGSDGAATRPESPPRAFEDKPEPKPQIKTFEQVLGGHRSGDEKWKRKPTSTGTGASHVRSFHCKLTGDTLENLDRQINEWLDAHPEYEVKFVSSCVGEWLGKLREPNLIVQVWV